MATSCPRGRWPAWGACGFGTGASVRQFPLPSVPESVSRRAVYSVAFSPDGKHLITGERDAAIRVHDVATGKLVNTVRGHYGQIRSVAVSADGRLFASASGDTTALVWDLPRLVAEPLGPDR